MARRKSRKNPMPAGLRRYWAKHRRRTKANPHKRRRARRNPFTVPGVIVNRRRRRAKRNYTFLGNRKRSRRARRNYTFMANRRRRSSYRRNPQLLGFQLPPVTDVLFAGAGLVVPPMVANMLTPLLPESIRSSKITYYGVKAASVVLPAWAISKFVNRRAGNLFLLGGLASVAIDVLRETGVLAMLGLSGASSQPMLGFYPALSRRGGLGKYPSLAANGNSPVTSSRMVQNTPDRLNPQSRF